jgi:hypothetical protein
MEEEYWAFHPMTNTESLELKRSDFMKIFENLGRNVTVLDI